MKLFQAVLIFSTIGMAQSATASKFLDANNVSLNIGAIAYYGGKVVKLTDIKEKGQYIAVGYDKKLPNGFSWRRTTLNRRSIDPDLCLNVGDEVPDINHLTHRLRKESSELKVLDIGQRYEITIKTGLITNVSIIGSGAAFDDIYAQVPSYGSFMVDQELNGSNCHNEDYHGTIERIFSNGMALVKTGLIRRNLVNLNHL